MDSYSSHCERMSTVDLHPLSLPISRLSPAKSNSSIVEQLAHHQHGKGDSAYSSFSGGSTAPDYPSPFLPDDVQSSPFSHYAEYVKSCHHPTQVLQSDSKTMDQLYRSVEAISQQYCNTTNANHHSYNGNESQDMHLRTQSQSAHTPAHPPPVPTRLDSFIATKNLENSRAPHHGTEFQALQQQSQQQSKSHNRFHSQSLNYPKYEAGCPEIVKFNSEPLYSVWRGSQQQQPQAQHPPVYRSHLQPHDQSRLNPEQPFITDNKAASELQKSASILSRSPPRGMNQIENLMPKQHLGSAGCNGNHHNKSRSYSKSERKRAHSVHNWRSSEPTRAASPRSASQSFTGSSIQHKGQFYFVTGVCKQSESGLRTHSTSVNCFDSGSEVSTLLDTHSLREKERCHSTLDNLFRPFQENSRPSGGTTQDDGEVFNSVSQGKNLIFKSQDQENHRPPSILVQSSQSFNEVEEMDMMHTHEIGRHTASNPIFYCGPDKNCPPLSATHQREASGEHSNYNKKEDYATRGKQQPLGDLANEKINKETTPLLYHLTGASRAVLLPKQDPGFAIKGNEVALNKTDQGAVAVNERPEQVDTNKSDRDVTSIACNALDDSFQKYYKEKLKDAQCKVLRETSFKRRDLQLPWQHCMEQKPEVRPTVIHSFSSSQDSETSTTTLTPSVATEDTEKGSIKEELWENQKETDKVTERENRRPANVAQPQVARIGGRKRLTQEQKKMSFSEPEKLNQLGGGPVHSACRSFGNESDHLFAIDCEEEEHDQQGEQGLVAVRRKMFEIRGRTLSASSTSKTNLKHLQQKALVEYMERKTGQKVSEPQEPVPKLPPPSRQRHSLGEKPFDWGPHTLSSYNEGKITKKKHNRPHSAGRILDSSSSSIRYAQFFSAQSCSGQYAGQQSSSRKRENQGPSQGKSASAESLLDQREPTNFYRNRSISTPHTFQAHDHEENLLLANTMETQSSQKNEAEESSVKQLPQGQQHARKVAQRGKSMEELGASKLTKLSALSKSSEHLDKLWKNSTEPGGPERCASYFVDEREVQQRDKQMDKEPENLGQKSIQGQTQNPTPKKSVLRQNSELDEKATQRKKSFSRSNSPSSSSTSGPGSHVPITDELRSNKDPSETFSNPPSPRGHNISEKEMKSTSSTPIRTKPPNENIQSSRSEREQLVDEPSSETQPPCSKHEVSLSCGVTTDPSLWILPPDEQIQEEVQTSHLTNGNFDDSISSILPKLKSENFLSPCTSVSDAVISQQVEEQKDLQMEAEVVGEKEEMDEKGAPEGETKSLGRPVEKPKWEELVEAVVRVDQSLARVLCPVSSRKTALMLMEQLLSEDTVLMEEHYKKKQELKGTTESTETAKGSEPSCHPPSDDQKSQCSDQHSKADVTEKKHLLLTCIKERLRCLEESRSILQMEIEENAARGEALTLLVHEYCLPVELERYNLFIGDLERVVNLLLCLSARLARVQNALSIVDKHTDAEEKESLDSRHRLLCKQREDAKDLKDNLDRRENLVSTFLSRQLSAEQLQVYRRFIQTKASLLIRQKDLEEKQKLGEEQLEALSNSLNL